MKSPFLFIFFIFLPSRFQISFGKIGRICSGKIGESEISRRIDRRGTSDGEKPLSAPMHHRSSSLSSSPVFLMSSPIAALRHCIAEIDISHLLEDQFRLIEDPKPASTPATDLVPSTTWPSQHPQIPSICCGIRFHLQFVSSCFQVYLSF